MLSAAILSLAAIAAPPPVDYVLVPVAPRRIVVRDYVLFPVVRSVVTRRVVTPVAPPVIHYYEPMPTIVYPQRTSSGFYYCPTCR